MRAAITTSASVVEISEVGDPVLGPDEATIDVQAVGLCGTDLHMYLGERHATGFPLRQGHEVGGIVTHLPRDYRGPIAVGQTVTVDPAMPCGRCRPCQRGSWPACRTFRSIGNHFPGGLADQLAVPVRQLHDASGLTPVEAALVEPFSVAAMAMSRATLSGGEWIYVSGAGPIGLAIVVCAVRRGHAVCVSDPLASRRELATELGATMAVDPHDDVASAVYAATHGEGADVAFEASGNHSALVTAADVVGSGGRLVLVGVSAHDLTIPVPRILFEGITIVGSRAGAFPDALTVVRSSRSLLSRFVSRTYSLDSVAEAFAYAVNNASEVVKVMVLP